MANPAGFDPQGAAIEPRAAEPALPEQALLFEYLETCRPVDFATRTETILTVIHAREEEEIILRIIEMKQGELSDAQKKKLKNQNFFLN